MLKHFSAFLALIIFLCASHAYAQQDFSKVEIKAEKVAGNVYMLQGSRRQHWSLGRQRWNSNRRRPICSPGRQD